MSVGTLPAKITLLTRLSKLVYGKAPESQLGMRLKHFMVLGSLAERDGIPQQELGDVCGIDANNLAKLDSSEREILRLLLLQALAD
jgi:DNA-binding MarR family transcriptional regulator